MQALVEFLFILAIPLVVVAGGLVTLFAVGALFDALENPGEISGLIDAAFRRPPKASEPTKSDHYYQPYWRAPKTP